MNLDLLYRQAVLSVAGNPRVEGLIKTRARSLVRRYVAGESLEEALRAAEGLERQGVHAILDLLGEMVRSEAEARAFQAGILELVRRVAERPWPKYVSLKPTQLGLDLSEGLALELLREILREAEPRGVFVRMDMEDSPRVEATLRLYRALREEGFSGVGIVLQSYLFRTEKDLLDLLPYRPNLRLVKGAYREPKEVAFQDKRLIDAQFLHLGKLALREGLYVAFATHDPRLIAEVKRYAEAMGFPKTAFEFQLLYGVRPEEQRRLAQEGYTVRAYVPYGRDWYPYLSRRIAERPENLFLVLRSLLGG
ncbi:MAG: proline dehydrogenase family protein [Thermus sp.]|uniref:proline dehydrogenase n=1 Tax=unclassified Thermus TaxID=2619321 RepID=UPI0002389E51|nr:MULTISPECIES: proline dehydrogenase family protein [unclassified Thermus]AEV15488.1 Proline dehydrogenase/delta-1-pyrroline-5-carboxylate dehydrogenase [Thermus sp. CCB_US3_UF1]MCS6868271.1 proline dehydrogenase family protein [Thermus sp.]MCS7218682.1 proline dehydrogenase family protein [Thermus sp.]MDW8017855.1 proline dehydrogenase family protein [Thermus sp.]MDW8358178.1 proline dehydrogenase family protein [Thermus sp.]